MAKIFSTYGSAEDKDRISLEVRPWALAATRPGVMFYGRNGYASASGVIWADVTFAIDDVPLAYQRVLFQFTHNLDVFRGELEEVLTNGGEFKWQFGYHPELSLVVERFVPKPESFSESDEEPEQESDEESEQESDESPERASGEEPQQSTGGELENASDEELAQESGEETNQEIGETSSFNFPFVTVSTISAAEFEALTGLASGFEVDDPIVKVRLEYDFSSLVSDFVDRTGPVFKIGSALT